MYSDTARKREENPSSEDKGRKKVFRSCEIKGAERIWWRKCCAVKILVADAVPSKALKATYLYQDR